MKHIYFYLFSALFMLFSTSVMGQTNDESAIYKVNREGFIVAWGEISPDNNPTASRVVMGENGEVYFKIVPKAEYEGMVKGVREGDKITVSLPQEVGKIVSEESGEELTLYADLLHFVQENEESGWYYSYGAESTVELTVAEDGSFSFNLKKEDDDYYASQIIGIMIDMDNELEWTGYGDWSATYSPFNEQPTTLPEGLTTEKWQLFFEYESRAVDVAIDGNDFWLGNLSNELCESFVKGTITEDGQVTFPLTYMGYSDELDNFIYFVPCYWEEFYYEPWDDTVEDYIIHDTFTFDYDAENKVLSNVEDMAAIMLGTSDNVGQMAGSYIEFFFEPEIKWLDEARAGDPLQAPEFLEAIHDEWFDCDLIYFFLPSMNQGSYPLDTERLSYVFYVDGEPFTFGTETYVGLDEDMTQIPFDFCDWEGQDIWSYGQEHQVALYLDEYSTVGVKLFYEKEDGTVMESEYVEVDIYELSEGSIGDGVVSVAATNRPKAMYNLQGQKVDSSYRGLVIMDGKLIRK